jgi:hypothetical protein
MLVDPNWGLAAMTLFSLDPAVDDETTATRLDPALDMFNPANGFVPTGSTYAPAFVHRFQAAAAAQPGHHRQGTGRHGRYPRRGRALCR